MSSFEDKQVVKDGKKRKKQPLAAVMISALSLLLILSVFFVIQRISKPDDAVGNSPSASDEATDISADDGVSFTYVKVKAGDDYNLLDSLPKDSIVITEIKGIAPDGVYTIPSAVDGYRVSMIAGTAFSDKNIADSLKTIVIPDTVISVENSAFNQCRNLADVYLLGEMIYMPTDLFAPIETRTETLTIHCFENCSNGYNLFYADICEEYDAVFKEWTP